jgi:hypothetical protein
MARDTPGLAEEQKRASLLSITERGQVPAGVPIDGCVGKRQRELEFRDRSRNHLKIDGAAAAYGGKDLTEITSVAGYLIQASGDLGADRVVVTLELEAGRFGALRGWDERLSDQQVRFDRAAFKTITLDGQGRGNWRKRSVKAYELSEALDTFILLHASA